MLMENILDICPQWHFGLEKVNPTSDCVQKVSGTAWNSNGFLRALDIEIILGCHIILKLLGKLERTPRTA